MAVFAGGQLRSAVDKEVANRRRKWAMPGSAQGAAVYIDDQSVIYAAVSFATEAMCSVG